MPGMLRHESVRGVEFVRFQHKKKGSKYTELAGGPSVSIFAPSTTGFEGKPALVGEGVPFSKSRTKGRSPILDAGGEKKGALHE